MKFEQDGKTYDTTALLITAKAALDTLSQMTTEEFQRGGDRQIRRDLALALRLDPDDYSL